jgi:hypothetical protein
LRKGSGNRIRQRQKVGPSTFHPGNAPLLKDKWEEGMSSKKRNGKEDIAKGKDKTPAYEFQAKIFNNDVT